MIVTLASLLAIAPLASCAAIYQRGAYRGRYVYVDKPRLYDPYYDPEHDPYGRAPRDPYDRRYLYPHDPALIQPPPIDEPLP